MTDKYFLAPGKHVTREDGMCALEWVSYLAGEPHSDSPVCVSPVLRAFGISLNDQWDDEQRQKLRPYLARCIGTAGDGRDMERSWMATDWLIRVFTPRFLDLCPELAGHAAKLRALSPVMAPAALDEAMVALGEARIASAAARAAARNAAWAVAWAAAGDAARVVAWAAAGEAARVVAGDAAGDAAEDVLRPVVVDLQASALDLFDRMLGGEVIDLPASKQEGLDRLVSAQ